jgi:hypothetical protein
VLELASATLTTADQLERDGRALQDVVDGVADLLPGCPDVTSRCRRATGNLAEQAGVARRKAIDFIEHEQPWRNVFTASFWLPSWSNVAWDPAKSPQENLTKILTADETGSGAFGLSTELLNRYGSGIGFLLPQPGTTLPGFVRTDGLGPPAVTSGGQGYVWRGGLLVTQGIPGVDPGIPLTPPMPPPGELETVRLGRGLSAQPVNPPAWARNTGRALGVAGAGLTIFGAGYSQWQADEKYHPGMSAGDHVQRAVTTAAVEGVPSAAGGWAGAVYGGELGATLGTMICPGVGTLIGGVAGGVVGSFVGSKAGAAIGKGARKAWHAMFG